MIKNRSTDPLCKTNLIVAPAALLDQWKLEIELKTNNTLSCLIYLGPLPFYQRYPLIDRPMQDQTGRNGRMI